MSIRTNWLSPPSSTKGQDQLGTQAPCEMAYSQLLPGITNVTERARYFSFYTWVTWSFDHRLKALKRDDYVEHFRRADCLYTLIAAHEASDFGRPRPAEKMVGRQKLSPALRKLKEEGTLRLSDYATQEENHSRYFQNELGGLGQYYAAPLTEMGLCMRVPAGPWVKYSKSSGAALAQAVENDLPSDEFWDAVEQDLIHLETLTSLSKFAPRRLVSGSSEHQQLLDLVLERYSPTEKATAEINSAERRKTIGLILHLAHETAHMAGASMHEWSFRPAVYARALPGGALWNVPPMLAETRALWAVYERNDLLSMACQTIFSGCLHTLESEAGAGRNYETAEVFARNYSTSPKLIAAVSYLEAETFGVLMERVKLAGPSITAFEDPQHEFQLELRLHDRWRRTDDSLESFMACALQLLATLAAREEHFSPGYGNLAIAATNLGGYPINLESFRVRTSKWQSMSLTVALNDLIPWILNTHLSVALRKLSQTRKSSFHLRPTEAGLQVVGGVPEPARTMPRVTQAIRILEDLGAFEEVGDDHLLKISTLGRQLLEEILD